jgi:hypothetical protein
MLLSIRPDIADQSACSAQRIPMNKGRGTVTPVFPKSKPAFLAGNAVNPASPFAIGNQQRCY